VILELPILCYWRVSYLCANPRCRVSSLVIVPLHTVNLKSKLISGPVTVGIRPTFPVEGEDKILVNPILTVEPPCIQDDSSQQDYSDIYTACVFTRAMSKQISQEERDNLEDETVSSVDPATVKNIIFHENDLEGKDFICRDELILEQWKDSELSVFIQDFLSIEQAEKSCLSEEE